MGEMTTMNSALWFIHRGHFSPILSFVSTLAHSFTTMKVPDSYQIPISGRQSMVKHLGSPIRQMDRTPNPCHILPDAGHDGHEGLGRFAVPTLGVVAKGPPPSGRQTRAGPDCFLAERMGFSTVLRRPALYMSVRSHVSRTSNEVASMYR